MSAPMAIYMHTHTHTHTHRGTHSHPLSLPLAFIMSSGSSPHRNHATSYAFSKAAHPLLQNLNANLVFQSVSVLKAVFLACSFIHSFHYSSNIHREPSCVLGKFLNFALTTHYVFSVCKISDPNCGLCTGQFKRTEGRKRQCLFAFHVPKMIVLSTLHSLNKKHIFAPCPLYIFPLGNTQLQIIWRCFREQMNLPLRIVGECDCFNQLFFLT